MKWVPRTCIYTPLSFLMIPLLNFMHINIFHWSPVDSTLWPLDLLLNHCSFLPQTLCHTHPYYSLFSVNTLNWLASYIYMHIYLCISLDIVNWVLWFTRSQRKGTANVPFFIFCHLSQSAIDNTAIKQLFWKGTN